MIIDYERELAQMRRRGEFLRWFLTVSNIICALGLLLTAVYAPLPTNGRYFFGVCGVSCLLIALGALCTIKGKP